MNMMGMPLMVVLLSLVSYLAFRMSHRLERMLELRIVCFPALRVP